MIYEVCIFISYPIFQVTFVTSPNSWDLEITWNWQGGEAPQQSRKPSRAKRFSRAPLRWSRPSPRQRKSEAEENYQQDLFWRSSPWRRRKQWRDQPGWGPPPLPSSLAHAPLVRRTGGTQLRTWVKGAEQSGKHGHLYDMNMPSRAWSFQGLSSPGIHHHEKPGGENRWGLPVAIQVAVKPEFLR